MDSLQEKFQIEAPQNDNDDAQNGWASFGQVHEPRPCHGLLNRMPTDGLEEEMTGVMPLTQSTESDVHFCDTPQDLGRGFGVYEMSGTDDMYTMEHVDLFYGEVVGEHDGGGKAVGFCERNNYMDRG